jgi:hypothetical protein
MYNYGLRTADRRTHMRVVVISLIAAAIVIGLGKTARTELPDMDIRLISRSVQTTEKPVVWTEADRVTIR